MIALARARQQGKDEALREAVEVVRRYETSLRASVDRARDMFTACREDIESRLQSTRGDSR